jgi:hypothetical protein
VLAVGLEGLDLLLGVVALSSIALRELPREV